MQPIFLDDPAWQTTFPHVVRPLPDEWLAGLLLRCDDANRWMSGTTLAHFKSTSNQGRVIRIPQLVIPSSLHLDPLAGWLALSVRTLLSTTYLLELILCTDLPHPRPGDLCSSFTFRVCPLCLAQDRRLRRVHLLLGVTCCLHHWVVLATSCPCGTTLEPFNARTRPFTCPTCGKDWADLPQVRPDLHLLKRERQILTCYEWFLTAGNPAVMDRVFHLIFQGALVKGKSLRSNPRVQQMKMRRAGRRKGVLPSSRGHVSLSGVVASIEHFDLFSRLSYIFQKRE